ncbi:VOC family protein [Enterococcus ratti]|uniref:Glyoxalase family protein n=1 Tax=Enterococcus ratti TaxID=150033 RepID=A0A1L8WP64_9ENTE|nr:VOC family protein [Enterococcus ratti]OJG82807.1 glyoxalase family protein [Enterococcus ratti]
MFTDEMKIMLYVDDVQANAAFWIAIGFTELDRQEIDGTLVIEIASSANASTSLLLYDREFIEQHSPEVVGNTPSLMFYSNHIFELYKKLQDQGTILGELVQLENEYVFNFADPDGNYFAVTGRK